MKGYNIVPPDVFLKCYVEAIIRYGCPIYPHEESTLNKAVTECILAIEENRPLFVEMY